MQRTAKAVLFRVQPPLLYEPRVGVVRRICCNVPVLRAPSHYCNEGVVFRSR